MKQVSTYAPQQYTAMPSLRKLFLFLCVLFCAGSTQAQLNTITADLSLIDGIELTPENIFNYRISNNTGQTKQVDVMGRLYYRNSGLNFTYKFSTTLQPGLNSLNRSSIPTPSWTFSETGLRELFLNYSKLPQGTYEYCVTVTTKGAGAESADQSEAACVYQTVEDLFLINLVTPENDAKIYEYNPMLAWVVNYPFASELSYKLRVAELKQGQTPQSAITRNNPMYRDEHVMTTGTVYPVTAKPLQKWQPYVWTVDAYYKGILLGGAEVWKFTIIDDSELVAAPHQSDYIDIRKEKNTTDYYAVGEIKIKYVLDEKSEEQIKLILRAADGTEVKLKNKELKAVLGDNRLDIDLKQDVRLKHMGKYTLEFRNSSGESFFLPFKYVNPELVK